MFAALPDKPDHDALERAILDRWERERTFDQLRAKNADGPRFSFIDGPVTANKSLAVHTAWGRTLKDVFQRYKALRGYHQRYQNGFDCQGLWIEVGRRAGARAQLEARDRGVRPGRVRPPLPGGRGAVRRRPHGGLDPARAVDGLGPRLLHVLRHEHRVHLALPGDRPGAGLALPGPPVHGVVPALRHVDLGPRAGRQLRRPRGPVALGALPAASTGPARRSSSGPPRRGRCRPTWPPPCRPPPTTAGSPTATGWPSSAARAPSRRPCAARDLVGLRYEGPFDDLGPGRRGRPPGDRVGRGVARGGHRRRPHRARAAAPRTSSSARSRTSPCSRRSTSRAASTPSTAGWPAAAPTTPPTTSSPTSGRAACSSTPARSATAIPSAGAATRR